jgi:glyoxylase-like metal-dependent hydrolase (beta-lactamase superfamily II)
MRIHTIFTLVSNVYLVEGEKGLVLIDTGWPGNAHKIWQRIKVIGCQDLKLILITHAHLDHYGSAAALKRLTGAPVAIHSADREMMALGKTELGTARHVGTIVKFGLPFVEMIWRAEPIEADFTLDEGDRLDDYGVAGEVIHTPGHTPGSCSLLLDNNVALVGDVISTSNGPHLQRTYASDWLQLANSLTKLQQLKPNLIYPGHGKHPLNGEELQKLTAKV